MIDSGKSTQTIVTHSKIRISSFFSHMHSKQEAVMVNPLRQAIQDTGDEKDMSILKRAHLIIKVQSLVSQPFNLL